MSTSTDSVDLTTPTTTTDSTTTPMLPTLPMKTQVVPLVYIQQTPKFPSQITKSNNNSSSNNVSQLQFATLNQTVKNNRGVLLAPMKHLNKNQQLVIQKTGNTNKITGTLLTMIKPTTNNTQNDLIVNNNKTIHNSNNGGSGQKFVIAPMPKVIKNNRLPVTVTTNSSKIAFMPIIPTTNEFFNNNNNKNNDKKEKNDETIIKNEKEYELSIVEDSNSNQITTFSIPSETNITTIQSQTPQPQQQQQQQQKFSKHGVSILKKNYQTDLKDKKVLDLNNKEIEVLIDTPKKAERRRKSNFSYRKDYDDIMEIETIEKYKETLLENSNTILSKVKTDKNIDIEVINNSNSNKENDEIDLKNMLKWEEGIGTLPGSDLKFIINEFNLIEFITKDEYNKIIEKRLVKLKQNVLVKNDFQEEMRCLECGCYGLPSEFISPKFCSYDCQENNTNKTIKDKETKISNNKRKRKRLQKKQVELNNSDENDDNNNKNAEDDYDNLINDNSQDKYSYPWTCSKKGFSWTKYLDHIKAKAAPVKLFKDPFPYNRNGFRPGMKLEGVDPQHPSYFCVLTIAEICGYRCRLHFDGYPDNYDFWANADSLDIFPIGWCEKHGHILQPPPGYTIDNFNWVNYLKCTKTTAAPKHLFANRTGNAICPNGFRVGMKLEAVDRKNTSLVCVATVKNMMDNRILVHFDSWDDIYDYWADPTSPYIHPVGWCDQYGHSLTPPNDYPNPENFSWSKYLKETKSTAAPVRAFKQRQVCGFKRGMRLECVDKRVPQLIRVATVNDVKEHRIRIHFDGWPDRYSYWVDDDSNNIHPAGWCQKTGHPIETPLTPSDVYDFLECPTIGCRGIGHMKGAKYATHSEQKFCPYAEDNIDVDRILPDRLLSPDRCIEAVIPIQREPPIKDIKPKAKLGRPPKYPRLESFEIKTEEPDDDFPKLIKPKRKYKKRVKLENKEVEPEIDEDEKYEAEKLIEDSKIEPVEKETWLKHSKFLKKYIKQESDVRLWNNEDVVEFVNTIPGCGNVLCEFKCKEIDGEAFLSLNFKDLIELLNFKVGPAVKLYNAIVLLRKNVNCELYT